MEIFRDIEALPKLTGTCVTVGSFDGVHRGHISLLRTLCSHATQSARKSVVVSFSPHPRVTLGRTEGLQLLSSESEKAKMLEAEGVDILILLEFNEQFSRLSYEEFVVNYLIEQIGMEELIIGFNHHLGHNGGSAVELMALATKYNFCATPTEKHGAEGERISSTTIRKLLNAGEIASANRLIGQPYMLLGTVDAHGEILSDEPLKLIPAEGRYRAEIDGIPGEVKVDEESRAWCAECNRKCEIRFIEKI